MLILFVPCGFFRLKTKSDGSFERYKARLVGDGKSWREGIDYNETFSPIVKPATICIVLSITLSKFWPIHQLDVKNAFLHSYLNETVYMHQPLGFHDPVHPDYVVSFENVYMVLNMILGHGVNDFQILWPPLVSVIVFLIILYLFIVMAPTLLIFFCMWMILFLLRFLIPFVSLLLLSWALHLLWGTWVLLGTFWALLFHVILQVSFCSNKSMLLKFLTKPACPNANLLLLQSLHPVNSVLMLAPSIMIPLYNVAWLEHCSILPSLVQIFPMVFSKSVFLCMILGSLIWLLVITFLG